MKKKFLAIISILIISGISCNSQSNAGKQVSYIKKMVKADSPGYTSTRADYYMKAKVNGKDWVADQEKTETKKIVR